MSGPNVVDKAKMVFHYVAKVVARPSNSSDIQENNAGREMKVCFRNSKHSIKCDINAPCIECDSGMKLYSYEQSRRHLDVVRSEKRFESIEVDRSENMIEKLSDIDENGKRIAHLLEMIITKQDLIVNALTDLSSNINESFNKMQVVQNTRPKHDHEAEEDKVLRESMNSTLKEISRNTLRSHKKQEEISTQLSQFHTVLTELNSNGHAINSTNILGHNHLSEVNTNLTIISGKIEENTTHLKEATQTQANAFQELQTSNYKISEELVQIKSVVAELKNSLKDQMNSLRTDIINELQLSRNELINNQNLLREDVTTTITSVKEEVNSLKNLSQSFADDIKESLPEKLMDVFGSILMLSTENGRKLDNNEECATANTSNASQYLLNNKNDY